ncbi:MAG: DUF1257 domain-containing protein [Cyanobacteriota bacterium]|nr:DUF1257 domain-containing protein [Cyanobacteriota bacterium]
MSHLTTLPTVLRDVDLLVSALEGLGLHPERDGRVIGFAGEAQAVAVAIALDEGSRLGWRRQSDGSLGLVGDLSRLSRHQDLPFLLGEITRAYGARLALQEASAHLPGAELTVVR